jgi:hypothetical protein
VPDYKLTRLAGTLLFTGLVVFEVVGVLHPAGANNHQLAFTNYAASGDWTAVHLAQFVCLAVLIAGLLVLFFAFNLSHGTQRWLRFFGAVSASVALALTAVVYAVDGVALKQAVDAWASAPAAEKATRFANAEAIRWLEWGVRSYQDLMLGLALVLYAIVIVWTASPVPRLVGYLMGASGLAFIVLGWLIGVQGFAPIGEVPSDAAQFLLFVSSAWLLVVTWRRKKSDKGALARHPHTPAS